MSTQVVIETADDIELISQLARARSARNTQHYVVDFKGALGEVAVLRFLQHHYPDEYVALCDDYKLDKEEKQQQCNTAVVDRGDLVWTDARLKIDVKATTPANRHELRIAPWKRQNPADLYVLAVLEDYVNAYHQTRFTVTIAGCVAGMCALSPRYVGAPYTRSLLAGEPDENRVRCCYTIPSSDLSSDFMLLLHSMSLPTTTTTTNNNQQSAWYEDNGMDVPVWSRQEWLALCNTPVNIAPLWLHGSLLSLL